MTFTITIGKYGGFYVSFGYVKRICLGWIAFDLYPFELEEFLREELEGTKERLRE